MDVTDVTIQRLCKLHVAAPSKPVTTEKVDTMPTEVITRMQIEDSWLLKNLIKSFQDKVLKLVVYDDWTIVITSFLTGVEARWPVPHNHPHWREMTKIKDPPLAESTLLAEGTYTRGTTLNCTICSPRKRTTLVTIPTQKALKQGALTWACIPEVSAKAALQWRNQLAGVVFAASLTVGPYSTVVRVTVDFCTWNKWAICWLLN